MWKNVKKSIFECHHLGRLHSRAVKICHNDLTTKIRELFPVILRTSMRGNVVNDEIQKLTFFPFST